MHDLSAMSTWSASAEVFRRVGSAHPPRDVESRQDLKGNGGYGEAKGFQRRIVHAVGARQRARMRDRRTQAACAWLPCANT